MQLLPQAIAATLPPLYATEETPIEQKALYVKFFDPFTRWINIRNRGGTK
jgi:hypothetical protein